MESLIEEDENENLQIVQPSIQQVNMIVRVQMMEIIDFIPHLVVLTHNLKCFRGRGLTLKKTHRLQKIRSLSLDFYPFTFIFTHQLTEIWNTLQIMIQITFLNF